MLTACTGTPAATGLGVRHRDRHLRGEVGLREDDDRLGAAVPGRRQEPLEPAEVRLPVEPGDDEEDVDVGGKHLLHGGPAGRLADDRRPPFEHGLNGYGSRSRLERDPVAYDRVTGGAGLAPEPPGRLGANFAFGGSDEVDAAELRADAPGTRPAAA